MMSTSPFAPDAGTVGVQFLDNVGNQPLDVAIILAPIAVPFVLAMGAIAWVLEKTGFLQTGETFQPLPPGRGSARLRSSAGARPPAVDC